MGKIISQMGFMCVSILFVVVAGFVCVGKQLFQQAGHFKAGDKNAPGDFEPAYFISETSALTTRSLSFVPKH